MDGNPVRCAKIVLITHTINHYLMQKKIRSIIPVVVVFLNSAIRERALFLPFS